MRHHGISSVATISDVGSKTAPYLIERELEIVAVKPTYALLLRETGFLDREEYREHRAGGSGCLLCAFYDSM